MSILGMFLQSLVFCFTDFTEALVGQLWRSQLSLSSSVPTPPLCPNHRKEVEVSQEKKARTEALGSAKVLLSLKTFVALSAEECGTKSVFSTNTGADLNCHTLLIELSCVTVSRCSYCMSAVSLVCSCPPLPNAPFPSLDLEQCASVRQSCLRNAAPPNTNTNYPASFNQLKRS